MDMGSELLKTLIDEAVQRVLEKDKSSEEYYKNLNKHTQCTKCYDKITRHNYKKDRSICRKCYSKYMLEFNSSRRGDYNKLESSRKQDVSDIQDTSNKEDISNKQVRSRKQNSSRQQDCSNKQVRSSKQVTSSSINLKSVDPDCLMEKFTELYNSKYASNEEAQVAREHCKENLNELLRVKAITKRQYNTLYKKCESD